MLLLDAAARGDDAVFVQVPQAGQKRREHCEEGLSKVMAPVCMSVRTLQVTASLSPSLKLASRVTVTGATIIYMCITF